MKRAVIAVAAVGSLLTLNACGSGPEQLNRATHAEKWIERAGYECASFKENFKDNGVCYLKDGGSLVVEITSDPVNAAAWYVDDPSIVGFVHGDNWLISCDEKQMEMCGQIATANEVSYLPSPRYVP